MRRDAGLGLLGAALIGLVSLAAHLSQPPDPPPLPIDPVIARIAEETRPELAVAAWRKMSGLVTNHPIGGPGVAGITREECQTPSILITKYHGYFCRWDNLALCAVLQYLGFETRLVQIHLHTVCEFRYAIRGVPAWGMLDCDQGVLYRWPDGRVASCKAIARFGPSLTQEHAAKWRPDFCAPTEAFAVRQVEPSRWRPQP